MSKENKTITDTSRKGQAHSHKLRTGAQQAFTCLHANSKRTRKGNVE
jgi:hypothetical protein